MGGQTHEFATKLSLVNLRQCFAFCYQGCKSLCQTEGLGVKIDIDLADDPFPESRVDETLTMKLFSDPDVGGPDSSERLPAITLDDDDEPRCPGSSSSAAASGTHTHISDAVVRPTKPRAAWLEHVGHWRTAIQRSASALKNAGKEWC